MAVAATLYLGYCTAMLPLLWTLRHCRLSK